MTEIKKTFIPQRLKNASKDHPYVAGAVDIKIFACLKQELTATSVTTIITGFTSSS